MSDEEADEASAMKYMMGFTDFGTSRRPKKVLPQEPSGSSTASGANSAPISKRIKTNNNKGNTIKRLSSSPPTSYPGSLSHSTHLTALTDSLSRETHRTPPEQRPLPGASWSNQVFVHDPTSDQPIPPHGTQASRYNPTQALGAFPSPSMEEGRYPQGGPVAPAKTPSPEPMSEREPAPPTHANPESNIPSADNYGVPFTAQEMAEMKEGKRIERGDLVYFKPKIASPDPWAGLIGPNDHIAGISYQIKGGDKWAASIEIGKKVKAAREAKAAEEAKAGLVDEGTTGDKGGAGEKGSS